MVRRLGQRPGNSVSPALSCGASHWFRPAQCVEHRAQPAPEPRTGQLNRLPHPAWIMAEVGMHIRPTDANGRNVDLHLAISYYGIRLFLIFNRPGIGVDQCFHSLTSLR